VVSFANVRIAVHPSQRAVLEAELPNLRLSWPQLKHVELVADPALSPGGAKVFTTGGHIDADLQTQLDLLIGQLICDQSATA
jgi:flagellar biosynthesis/type III secretory pathway protein FliH